MPGQRVAQTGRDVAGCERDFIDAALAADRPARRGIVEIALAREAELRAGLRGAVALGLRRRRFGGELDLRPLRRSRRRQAKLPGTGKRHARRPGEGREISGGEGRRRGQALVATVILQAALERGGGRGDRQRLDRDDAGIRVAEPHREGELVAEQRRQRGRQQLRRRHAASHAEPIVVGDSDGELGIEPREVAGRGGEHAAPIGERSLALERCGERQAIGARQHAVEQQPARLGDVEGELEARGPASHGERQIGLAGGTVDAADRDACAGLVAGESGGA